MSMPITETWRQSERKDKLAQTPEASGSMHPLVPTVSFLPQLIKPLRARASRRVLPRHPLSTGQDQELFGDWKWLEVATRKPLLCLGTVELPRGRTKKEGAVKPRAP